MLLRLRVTLSTITAFLESTSTPLPVKKSVLGMTPGKQIFVYKLSTTAQRSSKWEWLPLIWCYCIPTKQLNREYQQLSIRKMPLLSIFQREAETTPHRVDKMKSTVSTKTVNIRLQGKQIILCKHYNIHHYDRFLKWNERKCSKESWKMALTASVWHYAFSLDYNL